MNNRNLEKAALRGEPSYIWRNGQERRLNMILNAAGERASGHVLENGCGVGMYVQKLANHTQFVVGLEYDFERSIEAHMSSPNIINAAGESLPFPEDHFDLVLSHEVIEHIEDDRAAVVEIVRVMKPGGRAVIFCPNRGYPFETHGIYWRGIYRFGNIPFVNWLPRLWRDRLAPHVRVYSVRDLVDLFGGLPVRTVSKTVIFGAYDNIIAHFGGFGRLLRSLLQFLERTPLRIFGLSHFWVVEKIILENDCTT